MLLPALWTGSHLMQWEKDGETFSPWKRTVRARQVGPDAQGSSAETDELMNVDVTEGGGGQRQTKTGRKSAVDLLFTAANKWVLSDKQGLKMAWEGGSTKCRHCPQNLMTHKNPQLTIENKNLPQKKKQTPTNIKNTIRQQKTNK